MSLFTRLYYAVKPLLPDRLRIALRRRRARAIRSGGVRDWPINRLAGRPPAGWTGWPDGKRFAVVLTHDVEGPSGLANVSRLAALEQEMGFRSSFNFIPEGAYELPSSLRQNLAAQGFEIGIHDLHHDGRLYHSRSEFSRRAQKINRYIREWGVVGFRSAYMLHNLDWIQDLDIAYDASTFDTDPFEPQPDGVGTIFPFWVPRQSPSPSSGSPSPLLEGGASIIPDPESQTPVIQQSNSPSGSGYVELPYTLPQDSTLFLILGEQNIDCWKEKIRWIAEHGGMVLLNVHPDYLRFDGVAVPFSYPAAFYRELLAFIPREFPGQYWPALPRDVARCFQSGVALALPSARRRVCLLTCSVFETDTRVLNYAGALTGRGDEVDLISLPPALGVVLPPSHAAVVVHHVGADDSSDQSARARLFRALRFFLRATARLSREHARDPYDLVHVHNLPDFLVFAAWLPRLAGAPVVLDLHDLMPELYVARTGGAGGASVPEVLKLVELLSTRFATHVIAANDLWRERLVRRGVSAGRCTAFINHVDRRFFPQAPRRRLDDRQILLFPGGLHHHQGLDLALAALDLLRAELPRLELHLYGAGPAKTALVAQTRALALADRVHFFEPVALARVASLMADADIGIVPKRADAFGNEAYSTKIMEFMSVGIPVIASRTRIDDFYFNDEVVSFFEPQNPVDLARAIKYVLQDSAYRERLVANGLKYAAENSWETAQHHYLDLVDRLLAA